MALKDLDMVNVARGMYPNGKTRVTSSSDNRFVI